MLTSQLAVKERRQTVFWASGR